jgi:hypothetical protein
MTTTFNILTWFMVILGAWITLGIIREYSSAFGALFKACWRLIKEIKAGKTGMYDRDNN